MDQESLAGGLRKLVCRGAGLDTPEGFHRQDLTTPPAHRTLGEVNAKYISDGSIQVFGSPGIQCITPNFILEAGVQLPILQDLASPRLETDFTVVLSLRIQF